MKVSSTVASPYFFQPAIGSRPRPVGRMAVPRRPQPEFSEPGDQVARKQEIVCGVILALCLLSTVVLCMFQLVHS